VVREYRLVDNRSTSTPLLVIILVETLRFGARWKHKHYGSEIGCPSGDYARDVKRAGSAILSLLMPPGGGVFLRSHNKIRDTHNKK
jgi:hypothetical protein